VAQHRRGEQCVSVTSHASQAAAQEINSTLLDGPEIRAELLASCAARAVFAETVASRLGYSEGFNRRLSTTGPGPL